MLKVGYEDLVQLTNDEVCEALVFDGYWVLTLSNAVQSGTSYSTCGKYRKNLPLMTSTSNSRIGVVWESRQLRHLSAELAE